MECPHIEGYEERIAESEKCVAELIANNKKLFSIINALPGEFYSAGGIRYNKMALIESAFGFDGHKF